MRDACAQRMAIPKTSDSVRPLVFTEGLVLIGGTLRPQAQRSGEMPNVSTGICSAKVYL